MKRTSLFAAALFLVMVLALPVHPAYADNPEITVYKTPTCGCCVKWVDHLKANGFNVTVQDLADLASIKQQFSVPSDLQSCHTASVGGYTIEGHVPADDIKKLLAEKPKARGLAVPGMPVGSPGMEMGDRKDPYKVILYGEKGQQTVYASH